MGFHLQHGSAIGKYCCDVSSGMAGVHSIDSCHGSLHLVPGAHSVTFFKETIEFTNFFGKIGFIFQSTIVNIVVNGVVGCANK